MRGNMIEVRLFATFREGREKIYFMEASQYSTAGDIIKYLHILQEEVAICLINGRHSSMEDTIKAGDVLALFPPVGGG